MDLGCGGFQAWMYAIQRMGLMGLNMNDPSHRKHRSSMLYTGGRFSVLSAPLHGSTLDRQLDLLIVHDTAASPF